MKKIIALLFVFVLMLSFASFSLALENNMESTINPKTTDKSTQVTEILYEEFARARPGEPTTFHNLSVSNYDASGEFYERLVAKRYFIPNNEGEISVSATVTWRDTTSTYTKGITIQLIELDTNGMPIATHSASGSYTRNSISATKTFTGLDPNTFYFVAVSKSTDGMIADLSITVYHP